MSSSSVEVQTKLGFCPELVAMVRGDQVTGASGRVFQDFGALSTPNNLVTLRNLAMELKPERTLEVGLSFGGSCLVMAASHRDLGRTPSRQHVAIDPYQSRTWDDCGIKVTAEAGLAGFLEFYQEPSSIALARLFKENSRFGLIYVDGSHLFENAFVDAYFGARLLDDHGVIVFDDCTDPNIRKVLSFIRRNLAQGLREVNLSQYRADGGRPLVYRIAKLSGRVQLVAFERIGSVTRAWNSALVKF